MSLKESDNLSNHNQNPQRGNKKNVKAIISLVAGIMIITAISSSALTVIVLQRLGIIVLNNPTLSPSPTALPTPTASPSPTALPTPTASPSATALPTPTESASPTASPSPTTSPSPTSSPDSASSIFTTQCLSATPGYESVLVKNSEPPNIVIAGEVLPELGYFYSGKYDSLPVVAEAEVSCILESKFQQLNLVVGMDSRDPQAVDNRSITVEMRVNGELKQTNTVTLGSKQRMSINLQNVRSLGIKAKCSYYRCPRLSILETSLK